MSFKLLKKVVSIFTLITFLSTNSIYAGPNSKSIFKNKKVNYQKLNDKNEEAIQKKKAILSGEDVNQAGSQKKEAQKILSSHLSDISLIHIPEEIGRVVEAYQTPGQDNSRLVVHIQDLHTNPEAELNLAKILEILLKDYNLGLVCSEGADGEVDTSSVSSFPDAETREKVAKLFIESGELTGEEYLSITKYPKLAIWGIENKEIYFKNIEEFNSIMKFNPESQVFISQAKKALEELKPRVYSKELLTIGQKESDYENQKVETADYLKYLSGYIQKLNIPTTNYKNVALLNETISQESMIDQQKIMQELQNLLMNLQSAIAGESNRSDMDALMAKASLFKDQKISPFSFYSYLKDLADKYLKGQLSKYPNITEFTSYLSKVNSLDSAKLFTEMEDLTYEIKQRLARNDEERKLTQASRNIKFLEGFFNLKVSNEELDYYLENRDSHKVAFFDAFIKPELQKYNISSFVDFNPSLIDSHLQELEDFYKTAKSRDIEMFNNSVSEIEKRNVKVAALITGGFHTRGLTQLLKDKGYSYIVISPYSKTEIDEENYHFLLSGKRKPIEELINQLDIPADKTNKVSANLRVPLTFSKDSATIGRIAGRMDPNATGAQTLTAEEFQAIRPIGSVLRLLYALTDSGKNPSDIITVDDIQQLDTNKRILKSGAIKGKFTVQTVRNELKDAAKLGIVKWFHAEKRGLQDKFKVLVKLTKELLDGLPTDIKNKLNRGRIKAEEIKEIRSAIEEAISVKLASDEGVPTNLQKAVEGNKGAYLAIKNMNPNDVIAYFESGLAGTVTNLPEDLFGRGFGYDIRGNAMKIDGGIIDMTPGNIYAIGKLLAIKYTKPGDKYLVTGDIRMHTPILRYAMVLGAASVGVQVDFSEEALSSGVHNVYSAENPKGYKVQVQMSGSHGVFQKNGAKIKAEIGNNRLDPVYAGELARLYTDRQEILATAETRNTKDARIQEVLGIEDAIADMYDKFLPKTDKDEILVIDTRAGGGGSLTAKLLAKRGYEVIDIDDVFGILGQEVDMTDLLGNRDNIAKILSILNNNWQSGKHKIVFMLNMHSDPLMRRGIWDPSKPEAMVPTVTLIKAINSSLKEGMPKAIGGVYDGDADRVGAVKENGEDIPAFEMTIPYYQRFLLDPRNKAAIIQMVKAGGGPLWLACDVRANSKLNRTISKLGRLLKEEGGLSIDPLKSVYINTGYPPQLGFIAWRIQQMKEFVNSKPELINDSAFRANFTNLIHTYYTAEASGHNFFHASSGNPERPCDCAIAAFISLINIKETMADIEVPALKMQGDADSLMRLFETFPPAITSNEIRVVIPNGVKIATAHKLGAWLQEKYGVQLLEQRTEKTKIGDLELQPVEDGLVTVAGYKAQLKNGDSILIRWSNTGEQLTLLFEGHDINSLINNVETVLNRMKKEQQDVHGLNLGDLEKELVDLKQKRDSPRLGKYKAVAENISSSI